MTYVPAARIFPDPKCQALRRAGEGTECSETPPAYIVRHTLNGRRLVSSPDRPACHRHGSAEVAMSVAADSAVVVELIDTRDDEAMSATAAVLPPPGVRDVTVDVPVPPRDLDKLPAWARAYVELLQRRLVETLEHVVELNPEAPSDTYAVDHVYGPRYLPPRSAVRFLLDPSDRDGWVEVRLDGGPGRLDVRAVRGLVIAPRVMNAIRVTLDND